MGKNEAASPKSEKTSSPVHEASVVHAYPDWATMQAYYGASIALSAPYFNAAHAPHPYMWRAQPLMSPFGAPYAAVYPHGVYSHPSMPLGTHSHYQGLQPSTTTGEAATMGTPLKVDTPAKSSSSKDRSLLKKLKGPDGLAVSVGNGNADNTTGGTSDGNSQSGESGGEGSSDGSDGNNDSKGSQNQGKIYENMPLSGKDGNADALLGTAAPANIAEKPVVDSKPSRTAIDLKVSTGTEVKAGVAPVTPPATAMIRGRAGVPHELWMQDEREVKRERRKQSNRESARRSRLRKQAETEELSLKVETLNGENTQLRSEINRLIENSQKLKQENVSLMEKLQNPQGNPSYTLPPEDIEQEGIASVATENLLSKINNPTDTTRNQWEISNGKLKQLLKSSPRDTIAAG